MTKTVINTFLVFFLMLSSYSMACGPDFDEAYLVRANKEKMYVIPTGDFIFELKAMLGSEVSFLTWDSAKAMQSSVEADGKLLEEALKRKTLPPGDQKRAVESYSKAREQLAEYITKNYPEDTSLWYGSQFRARERIGGNASKVNWNRLDKNVPVEFSIYLEGARYYYQDNFVEAKKKWNTLLALPKDERLNKSVWAAFMLGKASLSTKNKDASKFFEMTRQLAKDGYKDPLDLASDSYGWQALSEFELKQYGESIKHYLLAKDASSLERVCSKVSMQNVEILKKLAQDPTVRKALLAWAVSRESYYSYTNEWNPTDELKSFFKSYLTALESLKGIPVQEADRIAWIYYNAGDMKNARRWVDLTKLATPLSKLIDARLALRAGDVEGALKRLHAVVPSFEKSPDKDMFYYEDIVADANSQIGVLKMARKEYASAFETLLMGKYWEDIAYVAEKVLTIDELSAYLDSHKDDPLLKVPLDFHNGTLWSIRKRIKKHPEEAKDYADMLDNKDTPSTGAALSYLLARRYARNGNWDGALKYYPKQKSIARWVLQKDKEGILNYEMAYENIDPGVKMKELRDQISKANNKSNDDKVRAKAFYEAGILMRKYGMEIMGTELDPDSFVTEGQFPEYESIDHRFAIVHEDLIKQSKEDDWLKEDIAKSKKRRNVLKKERDFFSGSEDEERRALSSLPDPDKRWHYRFKAAELMWKSAELLPDNDELKARALCRGGTYLKVIDKERANKFYKELIKTCGSTALAKQAHKIHWFPKMEE